MGEVVSLEAAIWFSDLRGFTAISDGMDAEQLIDILNAYFEVVVQAIYERGGDVLKYIGDAILAIFPRLEEHTSELQSLMRISYAVFCLKKKKQQQHKQNKHTYHKQHNI